MNEAYISRVIGRNALMKYCLFNIGAIGVFAFCLNVFSSISLDIPIDTWAFIKITSTHVWSNKIQVIIQAIIMFFVINAFGKWIGFVIIGKKYPGKVIGFFTFLILWILFFMLCVLCSVVASSLSHGFQGLEPVVLGWLIYRLAIFFIMGILSGFVLGLPFRFEVERKYARLYMD